MQVSNVRDRMDWRRKASGIGSSSSNSDGINRNLIRQTGATGHLKDLSDDPGGQQTPARGQQKVQAGSNSTSSPATIPPPVSVDKLPNSPGPPPTKPLPPTPPVSRDLFELFENPRAFESPRPVPTPRPRALPRNARPVAIPPCILEHELEENSIEFKDHWASDRAGSSASANRNFSLKHTQPFIQPKNLKDRISSPVDFRRVSGAARDPQSTTLLTPNTAPIGLGIQAGYDNEQSTTSMPLLPTTETPSGPVAQAMRTGFTPTKAKLSIVEYGEYRQRLNAERKAREAEQQRKRVEAEREAREAENERKRRENEQAEQKKEQASQGQAVHGQEMQREETQKQEKDGQPQQSSLSAQGNQTSTQSAELRTDSAYSTLVPSEPEVTDWKELMGGRWYKDIDALNEFFQNLEREHHKYILKGRIIPSRSNSE